MKKFVLLFTLALCVVFAGTALALTATGTYQISATVAAAGTCTVGSGGLIFGVITPPLSSNVDGASSFTVNCPTGTPYAVALSEGGSGDFNQRQMSEVLTPTNKLNYNLYTDGTYTSVWGDDIGATTTVSGTGTGTQQFLTPFVRVPAQTTPPPGDYSDMVTITVAY